MIYAVVDQRPAKRLRFSDSDPFDEGDTVTVPGG
jgi:hypothetical protein